MSAVAGFTVVAAAADSSPRCELCKFFLARTPPEKVGRCRRYPPVVMGDRLIIDREYPAGWGFPLVQLGDWCGEFVELKKA